MAERSTHTFFSLAGRPLQFGLFMLRQLPAAWFSGVRLVYLKERECRVSVPYKWFTRNPFRSTYFACLAMAAEMSTGLLAMAHIYGRKPGVSMLVTGIEGSFHKKATSRSEFTCLDGQAIADAIELAVTSGEPQSYAAVSTGHNEKGEVVAVFRIMWSFKARK
jgi:hypothetical protein